MLRIFAKLHWKYLYKLKWKRKCPKCPAVISVQSKEETSEEGSSKINRELNEKLRDCWKSNFSMTWNKDSRKAGNISY